MRRTRSLTLVLSFGLFVSIMFIPFHLSLFTIQTAESPFSKNAIVDALEVLSPWNQTFGGSEADGGFALVEVSTGGFAVTGFTRSSGAGLLDAWLIRIAADGSPQWSQTYGGAGNDIALAMLEVSNGGFALAGETASYGKGMTDMWLIRTDFAGNFLWNETYGGPWLDRCNSLVEVSTGGFALAGFTDIDNGLDRDFWLLRTNPSGVHQWNQTYGGIEEERGEEVLEVSGGGFVIAGWTGSVGAGEADAWVVRTDANGNLLWSRSYGGTLDDKAYSIIALSGGGFAIIGGTQSYGAGSTDVWLLRTDESGNLLWNQSYGGPQTDEGMSVVELSTGGFLIAAETWSSGAGQNDVWLLGTDADGNLLWNQTLGGSNYEEAESVIEVSTGGFTVIGSTWSFGAGSRDLWLLYVTTIGLIPPISFEFIVVLVGTLIAVITIASVVIYRRNTARI